MYVIFLFLESFRGFETIRMRRTPTPRHRPRKLQIEPLEGRITPTNITLNPIADNTLYEDVDGNLSNGAGSHFYVGRTGPIAGHSIRRGVLKFDLSAIPAGSTITERDTYAECVEGAAGAVNEDVVVHLAQNDWGEGTSDASQGGTGGGEGDGIQATTGDATWKYTFWNTQDWTNLGGDFAAAASATTTVSGLGIYHWTGAGLAADLQQWLDDSATNFGWLLTGLETTDKSVKQFDSRENASPGTRPALSIDYTLPPPDLTIAKSHVGNFTQGDAGDVYTIRVTNSGAAESSGR